MDTQITIPDISGASPESFSRGSGFLPKDIGSLSLLRKEAQDKIVYYDWDLSFVNRTFASRPDNDGKDEIQLIFNLNQPIDWQVDRGRELVRMLPGEVCVFRNNDYETSMHYGGELDFQFKSLQMATSFFSQLLATYFRPDQLALCRSLFLTRVTKTAITPDMYRVLSEIDSSEKYREFAGIFVEAKMLELIALVLHGIFYTNENAGRTELPGEDRPGSARGTDAGQVVPFRLAVPADRMSPDAAKLESLRRRIQFNPADDYAAPRVARSLSMSESKLSRLFRSLYGMPLHQYVQSCRLERAASLLARGGMSVSEAALRSGYSSMSHFSREFQKRFGVLPKSFCLKTAKKLLPENCSKNPVFC